MSTTKVIASGSAYRPTHLSDALIPGYDAGSWQTAGRMDPGQSYRVRVYSPHPSAAQLRSAGVTYPTAIAASYLSILVPLPGSLPGPPLGSTVKPIPETNVVFPPFGSRAAGGLAASSQILRSSPYAEAFALARRLANGARSPYAYLERVAAFLRHGYTYTLHTKSSPYPLENFLFSTKQGYCQHFAGAMALLLRMGGVPARVAVGFTDGTYDTSTHGWLLTDTDAHAWVEAWFPHYGWVRLDPTPSADPALRDLGPASTGPLGGDTPRSRLALAHRDRGGSSAPAARLASHRGTGSGGGVAWIVALALLGALLLALAILTRARRGQDHVAELARAYVRSGRPLPKSTTLAGLEGRLQTDWPQAAAYVRALRLGRFSGVSHQPSLRQRRALRAALAQGLGIVGRARAWWALPPRWGASHRP